MKRCSLQSSRLRLKGLAKELAEDGYRGRDFIVDGRQAAGLQGGDAGGDRGQIPHHHEAQHQAHTHLHQAMQVRDREGQLLASTQLGSSRRFRITSAGDSNVLSCRSGPCKCAVTGQMVIKDRHTCLC